MNPIARMMKRYIKTPLKYALPLLFIGSLVLVSISGCTSTNNTATATPTATPRATATARTTAKATASPTASPTATPSAAASSNGNDPLLSAIAAKIQSGESANNPTVQNWTVISSNSTYEWAAEQKDPNAFVSSADAPSVGSYPQVIIHEQWADSSGVTRSMSVTLTNELSTANATADFNFNNALAGTSGAVSDGHETHYAQSEVAAALGHSPTTINDISWHTSGEPAATHEYIQYDNIFIDITQNLSITGDSGAATP